MLKNTSIYILTSLALLSFAAFANHCPMPNQVHYTPNANGTANWSAPYYEGFTEGAYHGEKVANAFKQVEWGRKNGVNSGPGTTLCFYTGKLGTEIMMVQNNWGGVKKPKGPNWHWGYTPPVYKQDILKRVMICSNSSVQGCQFNH